MSNSCCESQPTKCCENCQTFHKLSEVEKYYLSHNMHSCIHQLEKKTADMSNKPDTYFQQTHPSTEAEIYLRLPSN